MRIKLNASPMLPAVRTLPALHVDFPEVINQTAPLFNKVFNLEKNKKIGQCASIMTAWCG